MSQGSIYSTEEISSIESLRSRLNDYQNLADNDYKNLANTYISEDATMWRYILAKSQEANPLDASEEMFRASVAWREDIDLLGILEEWKGKESRVKSARARLGELCFYGGSMAKRLASGGPVLVERLGRLDLSGLSDDPCELA